MTYAVAWAVVALQGANAVLQLTDPVRVRAAQDRIDEERVRVEVLYAGPARRR